MHPARILALGAVLGAIVACVHDEPPDFPSNAGLCTDVGSCAAILRLNDDGHWEGQRYASQRIADSGVEGRKVIGELLRSPLPRQRRLGAIAAAEVTPDGYDDVVPALVEAWRAHPDYELLGAMRGIRDPRVLDVLVDALETNGHERLALRALASLGAYAAPALPPLRDIATTHWDAQLRVEAAQAFSFVSGTPMDPAPPRCPAAIARDPRGQFGPGRWTVTLREAVVPLRSPYDEPPPRAGVCARQRDDVPGYTLAVGDDCLESRAGFECQGELGVWRAGKKTRLSSTAGGPLVRRESDVLAFSVCEHGMGGWAVSSLSPTPRGDWSERILAGAEGSLLGYAVTPLGVDVLVEQRSEARHVDLRCAPPVRADWREPGHHVLEDPLIVLLHIDVNGVVTERE